MIITGRYDKKCVCGFLFTDVLGPNCILDVFAGSAFLRFPAAASKIFVTLSRGDCLSWRKAVSGMGVIVGDCISTLFPVCGLGCSSAVDRENTRRYLATSRLARADEVIGVILLVRIVAIACLTTSIAVRTLEGAGKKLRQSS